MMKVELMALKQVVEKADKLEQSKVDVKAYELVVWTVAQMVSRKVERQAVLKAGQQEYWKVQTLVELKAEQTGEKRAVTLVDQMVDELVGKLVI